MKTIDIHMTSSRVAAKRTPFRDREGRFRKVRYVSQVDMVCHVSKTVRQFMKLYMDLSILKELHKERYGRYPTKVCLPLRCGREMMLKVGGEVSGMKIDSIGGGVRTPLVIVD